MQNGKKNWYIVDGWIPREKMTAESDYVGHECLLILNCNDKPAEVFIDIFFEDRDPIENVRFEVPAKRVKSIRMDKPEQLANIRIERLYQYSLRIRSDKEIVVQFGRLDVTQPNCAYIGLMGYSE
ncbi:MAG: sensory rhodopsin transducer [Candidatus Gallimonas sp.]